MVTSVPNSRKRSRQSVTMRGATCRVLAICLFCSPSLASKGATWHDVVRSSCYLRDKDRDYVVFNAGRTAFFKEQGLDPLPASTGIQATLCRLELLVEIEAIAMFHTDRAAANT